MTLRSIHGSARAASILPAFFYPIALAIALCFLPSAVIAQSPGDPSAKPPSQFHARISAVNRTIGGRAVATVTINEHTAMTLLTPLGKATAWERAQATADRLRWVVSSDPKRYTIDAQPVDKNTWIVILQGGSLITITHDDALAHSTTVAELARQWTATLARLLSEPPLHAAVDAVVVPFGESRTVRIGGAAQASDIAVQVTDSGIADARFDPRSRLLSIQGLTTGKTVIVLRSQADGPASTAVSVSVMKTAADIIPLVNVGVTGDPAPAGIVQRAFYSALARAVRMEPGAHVRLEGLPRLGQPLPLGHRISVTLPVTVVGKSLIPVSAHATITVTNTEVASRRAAILLYSNDPEQVVGPEVLYTARIYADVPARLDYHHQNVSGKSLGFTVDLVNDSAVPAAVRIIAGISLPAVDTIQVGRRAGAEFMSALAAGNGVIVTVPPYSAVPIVAQRFPSLNTVSGLLELHTLAAEHPVWVRIASLDVDPARDGIAQLCERETGNSWWAGAPSTLAGRAGLGEPSSNVFKWPHLEDDVEYVVGGPWTYLQLGNKDPLKDAAGKTTLDGNYGVDYNFTLMVKNPAAIPKEIGLFFSPEAGTAAGVFRVDGGPFIEFDPTSPPEEPLIQKLILAPGETRTLKVWTVPLNGSYYPASITVHAM